MSARNERALDHMLTSHAAPVRLPVRWNVGFSPATYRETASYPLSVRVLLCPDNVITSEVKVTLPLLVVNVGDGTPSSLHRAVMGDASSLDSADNVSFTIDRYGTRQKMNEGAKGNPKSKMSKIFPLSPESSESELLSLELVGETRKTKTIITDFFVCAFA